jgi:glycosyltransferase involved in cell wall biosynthesis
MAMGGLSVVIPALNAAAGLAGTLAALGPAPDEIIVVDGGSTDGTAALARAQFMAAEAAPASRPEDVSLELPA